MSSTESGARPLTDPFLTGVEIRGDEFPHRDRFPFNIASLSGRQRLQFTSSVVFFVGENGSGKSTLLHVLAARCGLPTWGQPARNRLAGERPVTALCDHVLPVLGERTVRGGFFSAEGFRDWAAFLDNVARFDPGQAKYHGGAELTAKSHGEGLLGYFQERYRIPGLYFMDEPESALSPASQIRLLRVLTEYAGSGERQFLIATHSPILMALPGSQLFHFDASGIAQTSYEATAHVQLYRDFLADPDSFMS